VLASDALVRTPPRTLAELVAALPPEARAQFIPDPSGAGVHSDARLPILRDDSRRVGPGVAFVAVPGLSSDGHRFLAQAEAAGAALTIVDRARIVDPGVRVGACPRIELDDMGAHLPALAAAWQGWPGERLQLAGITGTNGKTTCAHLLAAVFRHPAVAAPHLRLGTTGNWLVDAEVSASFTTPFPVELQSLLALALTKGATHGVMEVSSHALAQRRAAPLRYAAVAMTSFSQDHLDYHPDMEAYLAAKCLLAAEHCRPGGLAIAPREQGAAADAFLHAAAEAGVERRWRCSRDPSHPAEIRVLADLADPGSGLGVRLATPAGSVVLRSPLVGAFNLDNLMVVLGLGLGLGLELEAIADALRTATGAPGRLERVEWVERVESGGVGPAVYVDYAHTPDAVARAIEALRPVTRGKLIVVLGCGGDRDASKRPLMGRVASLGADRLVATSDNPRTEDPAAIVDQMIAGVAPVDAGGAELIREVDRGRAIALAVAEADEDDVLLIAGKGHEDYQILGTSKIHFDDREHAAAALRAR